MEFDKSKILTVVTADQLKEGQMGWINDYVDYLKSDTKNISPYKVFRTTGSIYLDFPFEAEHRGVRRYFYPAPEPTYAERQAEWVKENSVKVGTKVRFTKGFEADSDGSSCCEHRDAKGKRGSVNEIFDTYISVVVCGDYWVCPFTALEVIKEPTYRPYNNDELNDLVGEVLTNKQSGRKKLVTGKPTASEGVNLDGSYISAKDLLASFYRNTDKPCGVREDD